MNYWNTSGEEEDAVTNEELIEAIVTVLHRCKNNRALREILYYVLKKAQ